MDDPTNPVRINEKWIVIIIWVALLTLLYFTTANGAVAGFGGNVRNFYISFFASGLFPDETVVINPVAYVTAFVTLGISIILVFALLDAWSKFVRFTNQILIAFVQSSLPGERNPILFELLNFKARKEEKSTENDETEEDEATAEAMAEAAAEEEVEVIETDPDDAIGSMLGSVLKAIAACWVIMILTPGIIMFISLISHH